MMGFLCGQVYIIFVNNLPASGSLPIFCELVFERGWGTCGNGHCILGKGQIGLSQCVLDSLFFLFLADELYCWCWIWASQGHSKHLKTGPDVNTVRPHPLIK